MAIRKDAGVALVKLASAIYQRFPEVAGPRTVWTTGRILLDPGAPSIVPGHAEMLFQFRDTDPATLARLDAELEALVADATRGPCTVTIAERGSSVPQAMDAGFQDALERAAERYAPGLHVRMPSGAGHDAQVLAERMKSAMLFVPSIGGISHHYAEDTKDADIVLGLPGVRRCRGGDPGGGYDCENPTSVRSIGTQSLAALAILSLHRRPGDAECPLLVAAVLVPGVIERLAENVLRMRRQMVGHGRRQLIVGRIGHG